VVELYRVAVYRRRHPTDHVAVPRLHGGEEALI
jgi:hypothetical protein